MIPHGWRVNSARRQDDGRTVKALFQRFAWP